MVDSVLVLSIVVEHWMVVLVDDFRQLHLD
jgi:hypothetical protein